jgi:hypothetical protein
LLFWQILSVINGSGHGEKDKTTAGVEQGPGEVHIPL